MHYYQFYRKGERCVGVEPSIDTLFNLTALKPQVRSVLDLMKAGSILGCDIDTVTRKLLDEGLTTAMSVSEDLLPPVEMGEGEKRESDIKLLPPIDAPEVWAFGVTYQDSMRERQAESDTPDVYAKVYASDRPESFFKATGERVQPPFGQVGIRADSGWDVPEPELAFVLFNGRIAGYTIGNDMSSRAIEGQNPLYLPQAKFYDKSASFGPCLATLEAIPDPQHLSVTLTIRRDDYTVYEGASNTSHMKRSCEDLAMWLQRHNSVPDGTVVMTGTGVIPPQDFTLQEDDVVIIEIEGIGRLVNTVVTV